MNNADYQKGKSYRFSEFIPEDGLYIEVSYQQKTRRGIYRRDYGSAHPNVIHDRGKTIGRYPEIAIWSAVTESDTVHYGSEWNFFGKGKPERW